MDKKIPFIVFFSCVTVLFVLGFSLQEKTEVSQNRTKEICLESYRNGSLVNERAFRNITQDVFFFTDSKWRHKEGDIRAKHFESYSNTLPCAKLKRGASVLNLLWPVSGYGKVVLRSELGKVKDNETIKLDKSLAENYLHKLKRNLKTYKSGLGSKDIEENLERSKSYFRSGKYEKSLNNSLRGLDRYSIMRAKESIREHRKSNFTIKIIDEDNNPLRGVNVSYKLIEPDFSFGWFGNTIKKSLKDKMSNLGMNKAQSFAFWHDTEPENNSWQFEDLKRRLKSLKGFEMGISGLIGDSPTYVSDLSDRELQREVVSHVKKTVEEIESVSEVDTWECYGLGMNYMADKSLQMTSGRDKETNIDSTVNCIKSVQERGGEEVIVTGWNIDGSEVRNESYGESPYSYYKNLKDLKFDIGLDFMYFGGAHEMYPDLVENEIYRSDVVSDKNWIPARSLFSISQMLDWYSNLNRSVHIQYFQAPSNSLEKQQGFWRSPWNEKVQAEWIEKYYTLVYSKPYIESINYLEPKDSEWKDFKTGILYRNGTPKSSYYDLKRRIDSWTTSGFSVSNKDGEIRFEGYKGRYKIKAGNESLGTAHLVDKDEIKLRR